MFTRTLARNRSAFLAVGAAIGVAFGLDGAAVAQLCFADCNRDGRLDVTDFACFQNAYALGDLTKADCDRSGSLDVRDFACFQNQFALGCPTDAAETEIAGKPLTLYPFFSFVAAFNRGATVSVAVDPTRFPAIAGRTADIYIMSNRTRAQWDADKTLVDIRPGGKQVLTFGSGTIQACTFALTGSDALSSAGFPDIGVGYDLVVDLNRNGILDSGDLIDGRGDEGGFYVVADLSAAGPLATAPAIDYALTPQSVPTGFERERTVYPADIASMGKLPLVIISHGNGQNYAWFDYLQQHLASWGCVVMSHQTNTGPGIETCSTTTLQHTDGFLAQLPTIAGGVLDGHVDFSRIIWIGVNRGGEGVARSIDRIFDGTYVPVNYSLNDIVLASSVAPTDFLGPTGANPHATPYHLIWGSADGDVSGAASCDICQSFHLYERAEGLRHSTYIQGAAHGDFHGYTGGTEPLPPPPGRIGRAETHQVAKASWLALVQRYAFGSIPAADYLARTYEDLRSIGVKQTTIVDLEMKIPEDKFVIDDYQTSPDPALSSAGWNVTYSVSNVVEDLLNDNDSTFTWTPTDPMNGMTRAMATDATRGIIFDWTITAPAFYQLAVPAGAFDAAPYTYFSVRAAQGTQHPETVALFGNRNFTVTLRDAGGRSGSISTRDQGGVQMTYQRSGGWQNEFETLRFRLADFQTNGTGLDLSRIVSVRFDFGLPGDSPRGRLSLDDIEFIGRR